MEKISFEQAMADLEKILRSLEDGSTTLEEGLAQYEKGIALVKMCQSQLSNAEQKIMQLMGADEAGKPTLKPFEHSSTAELAQAEIKKPKPRARGEGGLY